MIPQLNLWLTTSENGRYVEINRTGGESLIRPMLFAVIVMGVLLVAFQNCNPFTSAPTSISNGTPATYPYDVLTQHNDNLRSGIQPNETILMPANVNQNQFGKLFSRTVDGQIYAQPLYLYQFPIGGKTRNIVLTVTMHNSVYAFDADDPAASSPLWQVNLGASVLPSDFGNNYTDVLNEIGILSTPAVDRLNNVLYVLAETKENGNYIHRLHALNLTNGSEKPGSPVVIQAQVAGTGQDAQNGVVAFDSKMQLQRPGLTLTGGIVYLAFASHGDDAPYHGWVMAYDAKTLQQVAVFNTSPNSGAAGVWQSGQGLTVTPDGDLQFATGNGMGSDATQVSERTESVVRLRLTGSTLTLVDWFTPSAWQTMDSSDTDLGSTGCLYVPGADLLVVGSKGGYLYVVPRSNMSHITTQDQGIIQTLQITNEEVHGTPLFFTHSLGSWLYVMANGDFLKAFSFDGKKFGTTPVSVSSVNAGPFPGGILTISSNGSNNGVVWVNASLGNANQATQPGILRAFDATDLTKELWNSLQNQARDNFGNHSKFSAPTVANGKVYLATFSNQLVVYGLLQ